VAQRVVLHIGTMKSGTSYLQGQLFSQRSRLAELGVLVPGRSRGQQIQALTQGRNRRGDRRTWTAMADEVRAHPGDVVLSHELLGAGGARTVRNLLPDLEPATVDVVITVRDLNRTVVSMWQETIQNGRTWTWDEYYESVRACAPYAAAGPVDRDSAGGRFWKQQDFLRMIGLWADRLGPERITVIPLPPPGADTSLLPRRFADATGIPLDPTLPAPRSNASLGLASALVVRELNALLAAEGHPWPDGMHLRKALLAKEVLAARAADEPRLGLEPPPWIHEQSAATVSALKDVDIRFVGEWSDLEPVAVAGIRPEDVDQRLITSAAMVGLAAMIRHQIEGGPADRSPAAT